MAESTVGKRGDVEPHRPGLPERARATVEGGTSREYVIDDDVMLPGI
jgi:hypothetical protein